MKTPALIACVLLTACCQPRIDCRALLAGWHPDIPSAAVRQCRTTLPTTTTKEANHGNPAKS